MSYLRFSPDEYRTLRQLARDIPLGGAALRHFLVAHLPPVQLALARKIARLDNRQMRVLHEHLRRRRRVEVHRGRPRFTRAELEAFAGACASAPFPARLLQYYRKAFIDYLRDIHPVLARKLSHLSEQQFGLVYDYVKRKQGGT